jgi:hypothetical protein
MQIGSLKPAVDNAPAKVRDGDVVGRLSHVSEAANKEAVTNAAERRTESPLHRGLSNWDQQLNQQLADAQQAMQFLEQSANQLEGLKADISAKIAGKQMSDGQVTGKLRQFANTWRQRQYASGGSLDAQLRFSSPAPSRQAFSIRGLNMRTLQSGGNETLTFAVGGTGQALRSVNIDPALSEDEIVQRFDHALAPANIRVSKGDAGALIFNVPESVWPATRDTITIKGDGIRFPTGQFNRVKAEASVPALEPDAWQAQDVEALRRTLHQVIRALDRIKQSEEVVSRALSEAESRVEEAQPLEDAAGAAILAQGFASLSGQPGYQLFSSTVAALLGISRDRVLSLLRLGQR